MTDKIKMLKPRITIKSIFRTTPSERKKYSKDIHKYNMDIMEQARLKKISEKEQADYLQKLADANKKFNTDRNYYYVPQQYVAPKPVVQKSSSSGRSSSSGSRSSRGSFLTSGMKVVRGKITYTMPKKTTSLSKVIKMSKPTVFKKKTYKKDSRLFK